MNLSTFGEIGKVNSEKIVKGTFTRMTLMGKYITFINNFDSV
jgi:hypothetical protein